MAFLHANEGWGGEETPGSKTAQEALTAGVREIGQRERG